MTVVFSRRFVNEYHKLTIDQQAKTKEVLQRLPEAWTKRKQSGLKIKKMINHNKIYEARIDRQFRVTFQVDGETITMRRVGTHAIYRKP